MPLLHGHPFALAKSGWPLYTSGMRRGFGTDNSLELLERMLREKWVVRMMLANLSSGSTEDDAMKLHRKLRQQGRAPCSFLDRELGIDRD